MRHLLRALPMLLVAGTLQAQPRSQLPDPVEYSEARWVELGRVDKDNLEADREALAAPGHERGVWVRVRALDLGDSPKGLFIYDYYIIDCEAGLGRRHMRLYVFDRIVHNSTGMVPGLRRIEPGSVPDRLCRLGRVCKPSAQRVERTPNRVPASVEHMSVNHGSADVLVAQ
jgi:hypothetical protein